MTDDKHIGFAPIPGTGDNAGNVKVGGKVDLSEVEYRKLLDSPPPYVQMVSHQSAGFTDDGPIDTSCIKKSDKEFVRVGTCCSNCNAMTGEQCDACRDAGLIGGGAITAAEARHLEAMGFDETPKYRDTLAKLMDKIAVPRSMMVSYQEPASMDPMQEALEEANAMGALKPDEVPVFIGFDPAHDAGDKMVSLTVFDDPVWEPGAWLPINVGAYHHVIKRDGDYFVDGERYTLTKGDVVAVRTSLEPAPDEADPEIAAEAGEWFVCENGHRYAQCHEVLRYGDIGWSDKVTNWQIPEPGIGMPAHKCLCTCGGHLMHNDGLMTEKQYKALKSSGP